MGVKKVADKVDCSLDLELRKLIDDNNWSYRESCLVYKFMNYSKTKTGQYEFTYKIFNSLRMNKFVQMNVCKNLLGILNAKYM